MLILSRSLRFFLLLFRGSTLHDIHKTKEGAIRLQNTKKVWREKSTRARAPLARKYTNEILVTRWHKKYKILKLY